MSNNVDVFLNLFLKASAAKELDQADAKFRSFVASVSTGSQALRKLDLTIAESIKKHRKLTDQYRQGKIRTDEFIFAVRKLSEDIRNKQDAALRGIIRAMNAAERSTSLLTKQEIESARAFRLTVPAIKAEIAEIERLNRAKAKIKDSQRGPISRLLGVDLNTSIYQLSAFYYLLSNIGGQLAQATELTLQYALSVETLTEQTGLSTQSASAYTLASQQLGINVDTVQEAFRTFSDRLGRATGLFGEPTKGSKDMARAMKELGIETLDSNGNVRSLEQLMPEIFDAFQRLGPGIKATAVATALFGQRADEMIPLLVRGAANIEEMRKRAADLGLVLTPERTDNLRDLTKAFNDVGLAGQSMLQTILDGLGPFSDEISEAAFGMAEAFRTAFLNISARAVEFQAGREALRGGASRGEAERLGFEAATRFAESQGFMVNPALQAAIASKAPLFVGHSFVPNPEAGVRGELGFPGFGEDLDTGGDKPEKTTDKIKDLQRRIRELRRDFRIDELRRERDFNIQRQQELDDFNAKQLQAVEDFKTKEADRIADFDLKQLREFEDYQIDRRRLIEDFDNDQAQRAEQEAERRVELEEKTRDRLAKVTEKWDEILLRLRIGGDVDSIRLAEQKRAEALATAQTESNVDLEKFELESKRRREIEKEELDLRLQRMEEDFNLRDQRRRDDFERELSERKEAFEAEQAEQLANFNLQRQRDQDKFELDAADRKADLDRKILDIQKEIAAFQQGKQSIVALEAFFGAEQTKHVADGKEDREDLARKEQDALAFWINSGAPTVNNAEQSMQDELTGILTRGSNDRQAKMNEELNNINNLIAGHLAILEFAEQNQDSGGGTPRRAFGGTVPGELGQPVHIIAHGGERITPPATASYFSNVRQGDQVNINAPVTFSNNVNSDAVAHRVSQRAARELGRAIAARRAYGG